MNNPESIKKEIDDLVKKDMLTNPHKYKKEEIKAMFQKK